jgi:hypothetical protein
MGERRIVRLLDALTPTQLAQRRYKASAKGRAAQARARANQVRKDPSYWTKQLSRLDAWRRAHPEAVKVYQRVLARRLRRESKMKKGAT